MYSHNCFLTLTYADDHLPAHGQLVKRDLQLFFKRLRKYTGPFRYVAAGEYGELRRRPHFHACIFGLDFAGERVEFGEGIRGDKIYVTPTIGKAWGKSAYPLGHTIGSLTFESAAYVARYITKRISGPNASVLPLHRDEDSGELIMPNPEFLLCSKGIGRKWFNDYFMSDVFPHARVITAQGSPAPVPRYYKELLKEHGNDDALRMRFVAMSNADKDIDKIRFENLPERRAARKIYADKRMSIFKRDVKG